MLLYRIVNRESRNNKRSILETVLGKFENICLSVK